MDPELLSADRGADLDALSGGIVLIFLEEKLPTAMATVRALNGVTHDNLSAVEV